MSKLNARVVLTLLISLVLIVAIFTTVQAKLGGAQANNASSSIFASFNDHATVSGRADVNARVSASAPIQDTGSDFMHDCHSNSYSDD